MGPNFVRTKVPELKKYKQVWESVLRVRFAKNFGTCHQNHGQARSPDEFFCEVSNRKWNYSLSTALKCDRTIDVLSFFNYTWDDMYIYLIVKGLETTVWVNLGYKVHYISL